MKQEIDRYRLRLIIRGAKDFYDHNSSEIIEILKEIGHPDHVKTMNSIETAIIWLRRMVEDAIEQQEKESA